MCKGMHIDIHTDMRIDMHIDICVDMRVDMCIGMRADICAHGGFKNPGVDPGVDPGLGKKLTLGKNLKILRPGKKLWRHPSACCTCCSLTARGHAATF